MNNKIKTLINLVTLLICISVSAQEFKPTIISGAMKSSNSTGNIQGCYGETVIGYFMQSSFIGEGFCYQLFDEELVISEESEIIFTSLPNPFISTINVVIEDSTRERFLIRVITLNGRIIVEREEPSRFSMDLGYLGVGIYGLLIHDISTKELIGKRKIVKR